MKKILTILLPVIALAGGIFGGDMLRPHTEAEAATADASHGETDGHGAEAADDEAPAKDDHAAPSSDHGAAKSDHGGGGGHGAADPDAEAFFTFPSQFFVPLMRNGDMGAIMILTLSLETTEGELEAMKQQEHRLRDALLQQLMVLANTGGFDGNFTSEPSMRVLREGLLTSARQATRLTVQRVLIEDIARQASN